MIETIKAAIQPVAIPCYDPGVRLGECKSPCAIIRSLGAEHLPHTKGLLAQNTYEVLLLVPMANQRDLMPLCDTVRAALNALPLRLSTITQQDLMEPYRAAGCSMLYTQNIVVRR